MSTPIHSIKHPDDTRKVIPSHEEAGMEETAVQMLGKTQTELPLNPVTHRGQDPELYWLNKYGNDDREERLRIDIRSLYRHEHISPDLLIRSLYRLKDNPNAGHQLSLMEYFGNNVHEELTLMPLIQSLIYVN